MTVAKGQAARRRTYDGPVRQPPSNRPRNAVRSPAQPPAAIQQEMSPVLRDVTSALAILCHTLPESN